MTTVRATVDNFTDDIQDLHPLEKYDVIEGYVQNNAQKIKFELKYTPQESKTDTLIYGDYTILVFGPQKKETAGGTVFYQEHHSEPDSNLPLQTLFRRGRKIANKIAHKERLHKCPYCGFLANDDWKIEKKWPVFTQRPLKKVVPSISPNPNTETCAGLKKWILPTVEVFKHKKDENPIFDYTELENCSSLIIAPGYPEWAYKSQLDWHTNFKLQTILNECPDAFKNDLDVQTIKSMLENLERTSSDSLLNEDN